MLDGSESESLIRKRKRTYSRASESSPEDSPVWPERKWRRDDTYYLSDGSAVFLVEDILFNVHRSILSKDNSSFSNMFTLPQGDAVAEGGSDDNPIVLLGDKPSEFRHFLWALYALPPELISIHSSGADLTQLIDIARISNKYSFKSLETWALDAIQEFVNLKPCPILNSIPAPALYSFSQDASSSMTTSAGTVESTAQLTRLVRLAQMCNHERLLDTMIALLRQLMSSSLQYAYLAMNLADELDLRALRGTAYLEVMQKSVLVPRGNFDIPKARPVAAIGPVFPIPAISPAPPAALGNQEGDVDEEGRLIVNPSQQLRLLSGYYRLSRTWERLRTTPPQFDHSPSCGATWHSHSCTQSWLEFWKDKTRGESVLSLGPADVLGRLKQVAKDYDRWGSATYMHHDCKNLARRSIAEAITQVEEALPDYFSAAGEDRSFSLVL
ncbi:hypothetical protein C8J56DRAFT_767528 [Mycena floridula]|nr:hypothetical protein C8J56DRAFT_767528 [Mycena floridula]